VLVLGPREQALKNRVYVLSQKKCDFIRLVARGFSSAKTVFLPLATSLFKNTMLPNKMHTFLLNTPNFVFYFIQKRYL
jgi:hypothetical protein